MKLALTPTARRFLRALVAFALLGWLAQRVGVGAILDEFEHAQTSMLLLATLLLAADGVAKAFNWQQLLQRNIGDRWVPLSRVLVWFFAGGFIGALVPSSASTDACRVVLAARSLSGHATACAASIVTLTFLGWFAGSLVGIVGLAHLYMTGQLPVILAPVALVFAGTVVGIPTVYIALAARRRQTLNLIERVSRRWPSLSGTIAKFLDALLVFEHAQMRFPLFLLVSTLGLLAQTGMFAVTAAAVGIDLPFAVWMVLVPLTRLVALVPVSIADFGLIQAAHVWVLTLFGVPTSASFALSSLFAIEGLLIHSTLGSVSFLLGRRRPLEHPVLRGLAPPESR